MISLTNSPKVNVGREKRNGSAASPKETAPLCGGGDTNSEDDEEDDEEEPDKERPPRPPGTPIPTAAAR